MNNKKAIATTVICICIYLVTYLIAAFVGAELNPLRWHEMARLAYVVLSTMLCLCVVGTAWNLK